MTAALLTGTHRLKCLLSDLRRLQECGFRVIDVSVDLPVHRDHKNSARREPYLEGTVYGHHSKPGGMPILTSEVHAFLKQDGELYARTLNLWSRLQTSVGSRSAA